MTVALWVMINTIPSHFFSPAVEIEEERLAFLIGCKFNVCDHHIDRFGNLRMSLTWLLNGLEGEQELRMRELLETHEVDVSNTWVNVPRRHYEETVRDKVEWLKEQT